MTDVPASSFTPHMSLPLRNGNDYFVPEADDVLPRLDLFPGPFICTSNSHPVWSNTQIGMSIRETDTGLTWWWNGSIFVRSFPVGLLNWAQLTSNFQTTATSWTAVLSVNVNIPQGGRTLKVSAQASNIDSTSGSCSLSIQGSGGILQTFRASGTVGNGSSKEMTAYDHGAIAGNATYTLYMQSLVNAATSTIYAGAGAPLSMQVTEI